MDYAHFSNITELLIQWKAGDHNAFNELFDLTADYLKSMARKRLIEEFRGSGLQTTELLNEAYLMLAGKPGLALENRLHFFHMAGLVMHRFLVDESRRWKAQRHGGGISHEKIEDQHGASTDDIDRFLIVDQMLEDLLGQDPILVDVVKLRYSNGFTIKETAEVLEISESMVSRKWTLARALCQQFLDASEQDDETH